MSHKNKILSTLLLTSCFFCLQCKKPTTTLSEVQSIPISVNENVKSAEEINAFIAPYKTSVDKEMDSTLAFAPQSYTKKDSKFNTAIGNMMADAVFEMANPVFEKRTGYPFNAVLLNYGGIRSPLNRGAVTTRAAYQIMPFENEVVVVELSGYQVKEMFTYLANGTAHPFSGLKITLDAQGNLKEGLIQGKEVIDNETYFIATSDYLQKGGDNMTFLGEPISILSLDYKIRNLLIDYFKIKDTIAPVQDLRFTKEK